MGQLVSSYELLLTITGPCFTIGQMSRSRKDDVGKLYSMAIAVFLYIS